MSQIFDSYPTKQELENLKEQLPIGYRKTVAKRSECSVSHVDNVLSYNRRNQRVVDVCYELLAEHKAKRVEQQQILKQ